MSMVRGAVFSMLTARPTRLATPACRLRERHGATSPRLFPSSLRHLSVAPPTETTAFAPTPSPFRPRRASPTVTAPPPRSSPPAAAGSTCSPARAPSGSRRSAAGARRPTSWSLTPGCAPRHRATAPPRRGAARDTWAPRGHPLARCRRPMAAWLFPALARDWAPSARPPQVITQCLHKNLAHTRFEARPRPRPPSSVGFVTSCASHPARPPEPSNAQPSRRPPPRSTSSASRRSSRPPRPTRASPAAPSTTSPSARPTTRCRTSSSWAPSSCRRW